MKPAAIGLIGYGNMGAAIVNGLVASGRYAPSAIHVTEINRDRAAEAASRGFVTHATAVECAEAADLIIIAVKPGAVPDVLRDLSNTDARVPMVSVAAGITLETLQSFQAGRPVIRVMPNTPALVGAGVSVLVRGTAAGDDVVAQATAVLEPLGIVRELPEELMDAVTGLSASGPAFVAIVIDALADGGVRMGLSRDDALTLAAQTVYGTAKMIIEKGIHPDKLRDMVASPGGTTIEGIAVLESRGLRAALIEAVTAAAERARRFRK